MKQYAEEILQNGGEGVMARKPESPYENGRSHNVFKFKVPHYQRQHHHLFHITYTSYYPLGTYILLGNERWGSTYTSYSRIILQV